MNLSTLRDLLAHQERHVVGIDGRSGAGKTSIAELLRAGLLERGREDVLKIEVEDFIPGWNGLVRGIDSVANDVVRPIREHGFTVARPWDWYAGTWAEPVRIPAEGRAGIVLVTGCGATSAALIDLLDLTVWVEAPEEIRRARVAERDSYDWAEHWPAWVAQEEALLDERPSDTLADVTFHTA